MNKSVISAATLIAGTAIGAGMLSLPITTGAIGFYPALVILIFAALFMLYNLFLLLEVNLWLPPGSNIVSMTHALLGKPGLFLGFLCYTGLFYSVLAAYTMAAGDLVQAGLTQYFHYSSLPDEGLPEGVGQWLFLAIFALLVYSRMRLVSHINQFLVFVLCAGLAVFMGYGMSHVELTNLQIGELSHAWGIIPIIVFSFTSHLVIPVVRQYLRNDQRKLTQALILGTAIAFVLYFLWELVILGMIPITQLESLYNEAIPLVSLMHIFAEKFEIVAIVALINMAMFAAIATSFIGVSVGLLHFIEDALPTPNRLLSSILTFFPPFILVLFFPHDFIALLKYSGIFIIVLFGLITIAMVWKGRYIDKRSSQFTTWGGKLGLVLSALICLFILALEVIDKLPLLGGNG